MQQRQSLARVARVQTGMSLRRTFITPTAVRQGMPLYNPIRRRELRFLQ